MDPANDISDDSSRFSGLSLSKSRIVVKTIFKEAGIESADIDARILLNHASGYTHLMLVTQGEDLLSSEAAARLNIYCQRRVQGEPVDKILGYKEFYNRRFRVSQDVLSPRPETEGLVDAALEFLRDVKSPYVLDLGTGSGAILISVLCEQEHATGIGIDLSQKAIDIASQNAETHAVTERVKFLRGSWFEPLKANYEVAPKFDLILSNPPYITDIAMTKLPVDVMNYDPSLALRGGADGLEAYRTIIKSASHYLKRNCVIIFEIGYDQGDAVSDLLLSSGYYDVTVGQDLSNHDRYVLGRLA